MRRLIPGPACQRHVDVDAASCPFCAAPRPHGALPLAVFLAASLTACSPTSGPAPSASASASAEAERAQLEKDRARLEQEMEKLRTQAAVYGAPPPPRPAVSASAKPLKPCDCAPGDPLCTCL
jgi:hypothetical protein